MVKRLIGEGAEYGRHEVGRPEDDRPNCTKIGDMKLANL